MGESRSARIYIPYISQNVVAVFQLNLSKYSNVKQGLSSSIFNRVVLLVLIYCMEIRMREEIKGAR